jgi:NitT/TauT family transport system permease protein
MTAAGLIRLGVVAGLVGLLELLVRGGAISRRVLLPPSEMAADLARLLAQGRYNGDIATTLANVLTAFVIALAAGFALGVAIHALPRLRRALDPLLATYYAVPFFAFYPVFIVIFDIGRAPIVIVGILFGVVAMIIATLNGLDRIPRPLLKTARLLRMGGVATAVRIKLPAALPYLFTGIKLSIAYAFIGVIASEFILASEGIGYRIAFAFNNFDNRTMYALMLFIIVLVTAVNAVFHVVEQRLQRRLGR